MVKLPPAEDGAPPLSISRSEITFDQWQACVADRACPGGQDDHGWGRGTRPIINITWGQAQAYAAWLSKRLKQPCRLPTEAEWERAARAGTTTAYWWGDQPGTGHANCRDCNAQPIYGSLPVGSYAANPWGLTDMNGNVWEWTADCGDQSCNQKIIKGGSWYYYSANATAQARAKNDARLGSYNIGLRPVCETP